MLRIFGRRLHVLIRLLYALDLFQQILIGLILVILKLLPKLLEFHFMVLDLLLKHTHVLLVVMLFLR